MTFSRDDFRKELVKTMPGYKWTVHKGFGPDVFDATGIKSSGFNRLSTLSVVRRPCKWGGVEYEVKSAGFGTRARWLHTNVDGTLVRALRGLQEHYEATANAYHIAAAHLQSARKSQSLQPEQEDA